MSALRPYGCARCCARTPPQAADEDRNRLGRDRSGEVFVVGCEDEVAIEVLDVQPRSHHLVLMVREGSEKHKFLLGRDERHWFAAAVPGDDVRDVRTAIASLRPSEIEGQEAIRQGGGSLFRNPA